ncbi:DUF2178 domain-containing protein [Halobacteriales archaeon QS_8_69_26]|nr:MAG: DUF2178 domain-containing protein [Halobacteriales archaeon QS_8_69_26]
MWGSLGAGVGVGLLLRWGLDYPLAGEAVYLLGVAGFVAAAWRSPVTLFDERDRSIELRASGITLGVFAVVLAAGATASRIATYTGAYDVPPELWTVLTGYAAMFVVFAAVYLALRYRS